MESLSLLKYLRGGGGGGGGGGGAAIAAAAAAKRSVAAAAAAAVPDDDCRAEDDATSAAADDDDGDDDEGPFFNLEFTVPENGANGEEKEEEEEEEEEEKEEAEEREFDFDREGFRSEPLSPSDDLFFKGKLLTLDPSSIADAGADPETPPHLPVALLKPAAKLRVFLLRLRKPKSAAASSPPPPPPPKPQGRSKLLVKLKVEESPIVSLFTRDNSSRNSASTAAAAAAEEEDERRFAREVVHKYLSKIKPLYVRVSKRYGEKLGFPEAPSSAGPENVAAEAEGEGEGEAEAAEEAPPTASVAACGVRAARASIPGLKVVRRRLGKSRSASAAVASPRRRDDSLLQQEDGIQSAIAHCKRSFHSAEGSESPFDRCMSDPGDGRSEVEKEACV